MSNYHRLYCPQCDTSTDGRINRGDEILTNLLGIFPELKPVLELIDSKGYWWLGLWISVGDDGDFITFLRAHYEHGVVVKDGYGKVVSRSAEPL